MIKVSDKSKNRRLEIICSQINFLFTNQDFWKELLNHTESFYLSNANGIIIYNFFVESKLEAFVYGFKSKNPFSRSNGYTTANNPNSIFLNTRHFNRTDASIAATIVHELVHCIDNSSPSDFYFGHGDNYDSPEKDGCAPQWIADLAYKYLTGGIKSDSLPLSKKYLIEKN